MAVETGMAPELIRRLAACRVGIAGAGGLGSNIAAHLVRAGLRRFVIADFDRVAPSNLNRQFYFADQLGQHKIAALAENLRRIEPDLELELHAVRVDTANFAGIFGGCEVLVEAFDTVVSKREFIASALKTGKPVVSASGIAGIGRSGAVGVRRFGRNLYLVGDGESGIGPGNPPLSPRVGIAAAIQANTVLAILTGEPV